MIAIKKILKEWGPLIILGLILYFTGLNTDVAAFAHRALLSTGFIKPETNLVLKEKADYNLSLISLDGSFTKLSEFKGKVIFLNIWATWCPPCIAEMPGIQKLYDQVKDNENIVFIMISMDNSKDKAKRFIEKKSYTFPVYMPASRVPEVYRSPSIPTTYIITPEGQIVAKKVGMAKYNTKGFRKFLEKQATRAF